MSQNCRRLPKWFYNNAEKAVKLMEAYDRKKAEGHTIIDVFPKREKEL